MTRRPPTQAAAPRLCSHDPPNRPHAGVGGGLGRPFACRHLRRRPDRDRQMAHRRAAGPRPEQRRHYRPPDRPGWSDPVRFPARAAAHGRSRGCLAGAGRSARVGVACGLAARAPRHRAAERASARPASPAARRGGGRRSLCPNCRGPSRRWSCAPSASTGSRSARRCSAKMQCSDCPAACGPARPAARQMSRSICTAPTRLPPGPLSRRA